MPHDELGPVQTQQRQIHPRQHRPLPVHTRRLRSGHHQQLQPDQPRRVERRAAVQNAQQPQECVS